MNSQAARMLAPFMFPGNLHMVAPPRELKKQNLKSVALGVILERDNQHLLQHSKISDCQGRTVSEPHSVLLLVLPDNPLPSMSVFVLPLLYFLELFCLINLMLERTIFV